MELATIGLIAALVIVIAYNTFKILKEYERGVVFFLGRFQTVKGPGLIILIPGLQKMVKVDLRVIVLDVPTQDVISRDNVSVRVNAVIYFRIVDPEKAVIRVANVFEATSQLSQTTLRSVLGQHELDDMLAERDRLNEDIQEILDQRTDNWGIKVANVEIKHVDLDESMIRAIAQQAEARARRAKVINAEGEKQAATMLAEAAAMLAKEESALTLRYLQTLKEIANEKSNTIVFPIDLPSISLKRWVPRPRPWAGTVKQADAAPGRG
jgi:regulator of protease activity HflC (stomatin/prohibitin superfamily)